MSEVLIVHFVVWFQVALKAAQKQLAATQAQLKAVQAAAAEASRQHAAAVATAQQQTSREASVADAAMRQKLAQLEGALRQASADYALILGELSKIRGEGADRQAALEAALAGRAAAEAEVQR